MTPPAGDQVGVAASSAHWDLERPAVHVLPWSLCPCLAPVASLAAAIPPASLAAAIPPASLAAAIPPAASLAVAIPPAASLAGAIPLASLAAGECFGVAPALEVVVEEEELVGSEPASSWARGTGALAAMLSAAARPAARASSSSVVVPGTKGTRVDV